MNYIKASPNPSSRRGDIVHCSLQIRMIKFTVITITYNAEKVLERTLQSVLHQSYEGVEHLIIDGASKDRTLEMAEAYKAASDGQENGH